MELKDTAIKTRELKDIPIKYRPIFSRINHFNHVQSEVFDDVIKTKNHIVVSAPTGSGKTKIFELAIVELLMSLEQTHCDTNNVKIIYVAPTKALCSEVFALWQEKFAAFDLNVAMATGDSDPAEMADLSDLSAYQIVITTPEKCDAMTRKWKDHRSIANAVRLVLIDEVHLVGDIHRGATLEAIVARIKTFPQNQQIRFISASAWLPNIEDIARWLGANQSKNCVRTFQIAESKRPVPVSINAIGYPYNGNAFQFAAKLNHELPNIVKAALSTRTPNKQILVFCQSRNDVESSLNQLMRCVQLEISGSDRSALKIISESMKDEKLKSSIANGFAYHHAGLSIDDRQRIETAYRDGFIKILLSTNTLAMGVNLPAHTVIIKSTERYMNGSYMEMPGSLILQMIGRAGRQQYNSSGCVYIMTKQENVDLYKHFVADSTQIESHLSNKLAEFLNAEIVLNTIIDAELSVMQWIRTTFFYARMCNAMAINQADANSKERCQRAIQQLQGSELIECTSHGGISSRPFGVVMAKYFLSIRTMNTFRGFKGIETIQEILDTIVHCTEWSEFYVRRSERKYLNEINDNIQHRIPSKITTSPQKISCLLQAVLGHVPIATSDLQQDADRIIETADRMVKSLIDYFQTDQFECNAKQMGRYQSLLSAVKLGKSLKTRTWYSQDFNQVLNLPESDVNKLICSGINTVDILLKTNPREIEDILQKDIPYGNELIDEIAKKLPCYDVIVNVMANDVMCIRVAQSNIRYEYSSNKNDALMLIVGDSCNRLILCEDIQTTMNEDIIYEKLLNVTPKPHTIFVHVIHQSLIGADKMLLFNPTAEQCVKSSNMSEMCISSIQPTSTVVSTTTSNNLLPPKVTNGKNTRNPFEVMKRSKSIKSVSSHWTNRTDSTNQQKLSQYFKKSKMRFQIPEKSVFDAKYRVEPIKNIIHSPDLFTTPTQNIPVPEQIYDFRYLPDSTSSNLNDGSNIQKTNKENEPPKKVSPPLIYTPIQKKINEHRQAENAMNGFVDAKSICKKDFTNHQRQNQSDLEKQKQSMPNSSQQLATDDDDFSEFDEDFLDMIYDELDELESHQELETKGLIRSTDFISSKQKSRHDFLQDLKLNFKNNNETIRKDFEDGNDCSDDLETYNQVQNAKHINTENQKSFFSIIEDTKLNESTENHNNPVNDKAKRGEFQKHVTFVDKMMPLLPSTSVDSFRMAPKQRESTSKDQSQSSSSSTTAVCGSQVRHEPSPMIANRPVHLKRPSFNYFGFVPPRQIHASPQNQSAQCFLAPDSSPEQKRARLDIHELLAKKPPGKEYQLNVKRLPPMPVKQPIKRSVGKPSFKNIFASVSRPSNESKLRSEDFIDKCKERLKSDTSYNQKDFDLDVIRCKLKLTPPQKKMKPCNEETTFAFDDADDDDDHLSQFDISVCNQCENDQVFSDRNSMMNFATPDNYSTFFYTDL